MISGFPWWFSVIYLALCFAFALIGAALRSWDFLLTILVMVTGFLILRITSPTVYLDEQCLYVHRMGRKTVIPFDQVAGVTEAKQSWPFHPYSATIHFTSNTPVGDSLYLGSFGIIPSITFPWALEELRRAINARAKNTPGGR